MSNHSSCGQCAASSRNVVAALSMRERCEGLTLIAEAAGWSVSPSAAYQNIVDAVGDVLRVDEVHLSLLAVDGKSFVKCAYITPDDNPHEWPNMNRSVEVGRMRLLLQLGEPIVMEFARPHENDFVPETFERFGIQTAVSFPVISEGKVLGLCTVCYRESTEWDEEALGYLVQIGRVLGTAVFRMQATKKECDMRALAERKNLGAEIHDGVSNLVGVLSLRSTSAMSSYEEGDHESVSRNLEKIEEVSRLIAQILRDEMLSMRMSLENTQDLVEGLRESLERFEESWGISARFKTNVSPQLAVPLDVSMQFTRILNECLSNILRHSQATQVSVSLLEEARTVSMLVKDDGVGFDVDAVSPERLGLRMMRQRAGAIGGSLTIVSEEGGTSIAVVAPKY